MIKGRPDSVQRAVAMVTELIKGEPGSASQIISKVGSSANVRAKPTGGAGPTRSTYPVHVFSLLFILLGRLLPYIIGNVCWQCASGPC